MVGSQDNKVGNIGFVGVGAMGSRMIRNVSAIADQMLVFDADSKRAEEAAGAVSGRAVQDLAEMASADVVILMLPTSAIIDKLVRGEGGKGLLDVLKSGSLVIDMSSSEPTSTVANAQLAAKKGITYIDAPVSGGIGGAESAKLAIMAGGTDAEFARARPILERMGSKVVHVGAIGAGHAMKALNNLLAATTLVATSEVFAVGRKFGLDPQVMHEVIDASSGSSFQTKAVWKHVLQKSFDFGFTAQLMEKDVRVAMSLIDSLDADTVIAKAAAGVWAKGLAEAQPGADMTILADQIDRRINS
jgi:3-hydroxyisobutyrate dehydrogenase